MVSLVVDAKGNPERVQVIRHLGMGLDQKAVEAVKQYRFKPATLQGKPVPVEVNIVGRPRIPLFRSPGLPVKGCFIVQAHSALFTESRIRSRCGAR